MVLAHIVRPSSGTSRTTRTSVGYGIFLGEHAHTFETVVQDDVAREDVVELLEHRFEVLTQLFHVLREIGVDVVLASTDAVVVLYESSARSFLHHVEHLFTVAHAVDEGGKCAEVLCTASVEEEV